MNHWFRGPGSVLSLTFFVIVAATLYHYFTSATDSKSGLLSQRPFKGIVVASVKSDDTSWLAEQLPDWQSSIYVTDDPYAKLTVPVNKGREAMAYLTYIIDNYYQLPEFLIFMHGPRYQWHNDDPLYDAVPLIRSLQLPYVAKMGYAPLRCTWIPGCPAELNPLEPSDHGPENRVLTEKAYASAFEKLLPGSPVPESVGAPCSSQFAVTRDQVTKRSKSEYERMRQWLLETDLPDGTSGRIMEYSWHMIMQMSPVHCPPAGECYCVMFGLCDLNCTVVRCENRYILPTYAQTPEGWPETGGGENGWPVPGWHEL